MLIIWRGISIDLGNLKHAHFTNSISLISQRNALLIKSVGRQSKKTKETWQEVKRPESLMQKKDQPF